MFITHNSAGLCDILASRAWSYGCGRAPFLIYTYNCAYYTEGNMIMNMRATMCCEFRITVASFPMYFKKILKGLIQV